MTLKEYQQRAIAGARLPIDRTIDYYALALCGEIGELLELEFESMSHPRDHVSELGDIMFYCVVIAHKLDFELKQMAESYQYPDVGCQRVAGMAMLAGLFANQCKKLVRDRKPLDLEKAEATIGAIIGLCDAAADDEPLSMTGMDKVLTGQLTKLEERKKRDLVAHRP